MPDREKVIKGLECCLPPHDPDCDLCPYDSIDLRCRAKLRDDIIALLKAQEPRVMAVGEMWALGFNDAIIIEQKIPPLLIPAIVRDNIKHDCNLEVLQVVTASTSGTANADYDYYGKTWRCWTSRPTDEQREVTPWN